MGPARRGRRELAYGVGDAAPYCRAVVIVLRRKLIGAGGAFVEGLLAITLEHQARGHARCRFRVSRPKVIAYRGAIQREDVTKTFGRSLSPIRSYGTYDDQLTGDTGRYH